MEKQNIRIKLRAYDNKILDQSTLEIVNTVKRTGANIKGPIPLPTKIEKYTEYSAGAVTIKPEEGDLLIFPSYLYHAVDENLSDDNRVVVSFNIDIGY